MDALSTSNAAARGMALEQVGAYLLGIAFSSPRRLSDVFNFVIENDLQDRKVQLVAIHQLDRKHTCKPVNILSRVPTPTYVVGYSPRTVEETLAWIKNSQQTVFCFPANSVGPDLILVLMLSDNTVLRVLIQFKTQKTMGPSDTKNALRSTDPQKFITERRPSTQGPSQAQGKKKNRYALLHHFSPAHPVRQCKRVPCCEPGYEPKASGCSRSFGLGNRQGW